MESPNVENRVNELIKAFELATGPGDQKLTSMARRASENHQKLQNSVKNLQASLDYLRLCVKYQLFDLEATRRENKHLREMLDKKRDGN